MKKHNRFTWACATALFLVIWMLPACAPEDKRLDLASLLPAKWSPYTTLRLDANADGKKDWVILYTYDEKDKGAFTPVGGVVYHADRGEPPVVFPYPLVAPGWAYLGEGKSTIGMQDVISSLTGPELVFQSVNSDNITNRIVMFSWKDQAPNKLLPPSADPAMGQWYHCVGKFSADGGIKLEANRVTTWERTQERSQLAIRRVYQSQQGGYLSNDQLVAPIQSCLDFAYDQPKDVNQSPYPEKILMAFYQNFTSDAAFSFMTDEAKANLRSGYGFWKNVAPWPRTAVTGVCVKELNYNPDEATQAEAAMLIQAQQEQIAQATAAAAGVCNCPQPQCTCAPTPTQPIVSPPVWVVARVEYSLQNQTQEIKLQWGLVKINGVWRISQVVPLP